MGKGSAESFFSQQEQQRIRDAVAEVEAQSRGEIVPVVIGSAAEYRYTVALASGLLSLTLLALLLWGLTPWLEMESYAHHLFWQLPALFLLFFLLLQFSIHRLPSLKRLLIPRQESKERVAEKALTLFTWHGLHKTRDHTGILILISLFERQVEVLADAGIHAKVDAGEWQRVVDEIVSGLHSGQACDALCRAIGHCQQLLADHFPHQGEDSNELPDLILHS
ncbi:MAG: TPM domain-containing protein [Desulfuromonadaceae bacterium]|nr:TPM domain-containing protein [Desulfuromonadaceae bacterium]